MALPRKLKNLVLFNDGNNYLGQVATVTLPKLTRKMEDWRGGGMDGAVKIDMGQEALQLAWTAGGILPTAVRQFGATDASGVPLRFAGAYQADDTGTVDAVEVAVRGRHSEIEMGDAKVGEATEHKFTTELSYYKLTVNGRVEVEIDLLNFVFNVNGVDRLADQRSALGI